MLNLLKIMTLTILLAACWQPQPITRVQKILGLVEAQVSLNGIATARLLPNKIRTQNALSDNAITFERKFVSSFEDETSKTRYLSATFQINNTTDQDFNNLSFQAYTQTNNGLGGTAIKAMVNFGGELITDPAIAQSIKPTHEMKRQGLAINVNPEAAQFQGYTSQETQNLEQNAKNNNIIGQTDQILEYGYIAQNLNGQRQIAKRSTGLLTIAVKYPSTTKTLNPYKFVMTFVLADDNITRVTRSPDESTTQAQQRANQIGASELMLIGGDADTSTTPNSLRTNNLLIGTAPTYLLESTFSINKVSPSVINNDQEQQVTVYGTDFDHQTEFFIEARRLRVLSQTNNSAILTIPARLEPSNYGMIARQANGSRATLYPALLVRAGEAPRAIDPQANAFVFIEGYVFDNTTNQAIENAKVSILGLETVTDQNGYYLMRGIPTRKNHLTIKADGYTDNYRTLEILDETAKTIQVKPVLLQPHNHNATLIGRNGGTHYATPNNSQGAHFIVPPDALEQDTYISLTELPEETAPEFTEDQTYLSAAHFEPSGLVFKKPALYNTPLPSTNNLPVGTSVKVGTYDHSTGEWIEEAQQGKIISLQGKKFLQIEMLHFSHGSGWYPEKKGGGGTSGILYTACVRYDDGTAAAIVPTNRGYTDDFGMIDFWANSLTPSFYTLNPKSAFGSPVPKPEIPATCIILPKPKTGTLNPLQPQQDDACNPDPRPFPVDKGATLKPQSTNLEKQLLISSTTTALSTQLLDFSSANIDPSSLKVLVNSEDVTKRIDIKQNASSVRIDYKLLTNLPAKANSEFVIRAKSRGTASEPPVLLEARTMADVVAGFQVPTVHLRFADDALDPTIQTPFVEQDSLGIYIVAREGQALSEIDALIPVQAIDEKGQLLNVTTITRYSFDSTGWASDVIVNGSAAIENGIAQLPIRIALSAQHDEILSDRISFSKIQSAVSNASSGIRVQSLTGLVCFQAQKPNPIKECEKAIQQMNPEIDKLIIRFGIPNFIKQEITAIRSIYKTTPACQQADALANLMFILTFYQAETAINNGNIAFLGSLARKGDLVYLDYCLDKYARYVYNTVYPNYSTLQIGATYLVAALGIEAVDLLIRKFPWLARPIGRSGAGKPAASAAKPIVESNSSPRVPITGVPGSGFTIRFSNGGTLRVLGVEFYEYEWNTAYYIARTQGRNIELRVDGVSSAASPVRGTSPTRVSDMVLDNSIPADIIGITTTNPNNVVSGIVRKSSQANVVYVVLDETTLTAAALEAHAQSLGFPTFQQLVNASNGGTAPTVVFLPKPLPKAPNPERVTFINR